MSIVERLLGSWTEQNRRAGEHTKIKKLYVGVKEANEIKQTVAECFPNCPYRFGFDSIANLLEIQTDQIEIVCQPEWLGIEFEDLLSPGIKKLNEEILQKIETYGTQTQGHTGTTA